MSTTAPRSFLPIRIADENLPVLNAVAAEARALISNGNPSPAELEGLIRKDASLSSQVLSLANSPIYGGRVKFTSISQAVVRLGIQALGKVIMVAAVGDTFPKDDDFATELWEHSVAVAETGRWLSAKLAIQDPEECFLAGIIHDVGKILIYSQHPEAYRQLIAEAAELKTPVHRHEGTSFSIQTHEWVGGIMGRKWGVAKPILDVMKGHNRIERSEKCDEETCEFVALVSLANMICRKLGYCAEAELAGNIPASIPAKILGIEESLLPEAEEALPDLIDESLMSFR